MLDLADAAVTIPGCYYWTSGEAPAGERWNPFDAGRLLRPTPEALRTIDPAYIEQAIAAFLRTGFHGPLNYYRPLDRFFETAAGPYAGATIRQPSWFLSGSEDGLRSLQPDEATMRKALPGLRGVTMLDGIGHWPQLEAAASVNQTLLEFLAQTAH